MNTPHVSIETITPQMAETYLVMNVENRPIRQSVVDRYAADMTAGQWKFAGEPIQFAGERLLNGQHRLLACIKSAQPITVVVVRNIDPDAFEVMDSGMKRSVADVVQARLNIPNSTIVAAAARFILAMQRSDMARSHENGRASISRHNIVAEVSEHRALYELAARNAKRVQNQCGFRPTSMIAFIVHLVRLGAEPVTVLDFIDRTANGDNLSAGDPRLALRNWVMRRERVTAEEEFAVLVHAWNAWTNNEQRKIVKRIRRGETLPKVANIARQFAATGRVA